jgi:serine/threonine-protein kinase
MSPEQLAGKKVDGRSDLYSLGVMLFQMLAGVLPFRGDSMAELMYKIANEDAPDIRIIRQELPENLANLVALSLSKRPETRYQDGDQFASDLRIVLATLGADFGASPASQSGRSSATKPSGNDERTMAFSSGTSAVSSADFVKTSITAPLSPFISEKSGDNPAVTANKPGASGTVTDIEI